MICGWHQHQKCIIHEDRVHPQVGYDRPGWLRCEQFGAGMITGWGAHHIDSAHWGMGMESSGPVEMWSEKVSICNRWFMGCTWHF